MGIYRDYISEENDMQTMLFRYSVTVDVFDARLPNEMKCGHKLSDEFKKKLLRRPYTEQTDRLIFLYGTGVISEEALKALTLHNDSDFLADVISVENEVRKNEGENASDILSYEQLQRLLLLCANSKRFENITPIDFNGALELASASHIAITEDGFVKCDGGLMKALTETDVSFGFYNKEEDSFKIQETRYVVQAAEKNLDILAEENPAVSELSVLICCLSVYDKVYGKEFISYAKSNGITFDDNFSEEYEKYLNDVKLTFEIKGFPKKRDICGDRINQYDYAVNSIEENKLVGSALNENDDYSAVIRLDPDEPLSETELTAKALRKYKNSRQCLENMVIKLTHGGRTDIYIYRKGEFSPVDSVDFSRQLFDFNKIWSIIQLCSRSRKIRKQGDVITLPPEFMEEIPAEQRVYAANMVKEQYLLMLSRQQNNKHFQSLNDIKEKASENMKKIAEEKERKEAEKAARQAARKPSVSKTSEN